MVEGEKPVRVAVLGPLEVERTGKDMTPKSLLQRRLLALLTLRAPRSVPIDSLMAVAWPDGNVPKEPGDNLQTHISRLRRHLRAEGADGAIVHDADCYGLATDRISSDLDDLAVLIGTRPGDAGAVGLDRVEAALALWRGPSLADISDTEPAMGDATRLDELRLSLMETRFDLRSQIAPAPHLIADLDAFTRDHPYRERPYGVLMELLYSLGRQADALSVYQRLRSRLADDLGLEPTAALRELEAQILDHRVERRSPPPAAAPAGQAEPRTNRPPAATTTLVGRAGDLARLRVALGRSRLVTIAGPAGVGKTRLAMEIGHELTDGGDRAVVWCDLTPAADEAELLVIVAQALGAQRHGRQSTREAILGAVAGLEPTLLLDNCEHLGDIVPHFVSELLAASSSARVLATTRSPLDVVGEELLWLQPMPWGGNTERPAAVELFWQRSAAAGVDLVDDVPNRELAARVCSAVDGLPLGIELAAAQLRNMTLDELVDRVTAASGALDVARRSGTERHRSIRSALAWSLDAIPAEDRRFFEALSVFPGSFDAAAAAAVTDVVDVDAAAIRLRALGDLCLVGVDVGRTGTRFRLLRTARLIGHERATSDGLASELRSRHRAWVIDLVQRIGPLVRGPSEAVAVQRIETEIDSIRGVIRRAATDGDADTALSVTAAVSDFAIHRLRDDIVDWSELALAIDGADGHPLQASAKATLAMAATNRGDLELARTLALGVLDDDTADLVATLHAHHALSLAALYSGALEEASAVAADHLALADRTDEAFDAQFATMVSALAAQYGGRHEDAVEWAHRSQVYAERGGAPTSRAWSDHVIGEVLADVDPAHARSRFESAIATGETVHNELVVGVARLALTALPFDDGHEETVLRAYRSLIENWSSRNDWTHQWTTLQNLVPVLAQCGAHAEAVLLASALTTGAGHARNFGDAADSMTRAAATFEQQFGRQTLERVKATASTLTTRATIDHALKSIDDLLSSHERH